MTDPTAPVTPRTEAGRRLLGVAYLAGDAASEGVNLNDAILAIEREAASTDALRAALKHILYRARSHKEIIDTASAALAASDAGPAGSTDALRVALETIKGELRHYDLSNDPGYIRVPTERVRAVFVAALAASDAGPSVHDLPGHKAHECRICGNWTDAGPAGIDVERLAEFFHEEYWAEANEPHWPREQADATDCEVCWSSAAKLHARLSRESDR
jgi:hypothetical protein